MPVSEDNPAARVTRSLRKRLTSVDSDVSSRPGTPQMMSSPSKPARVMTRRRSIQSDVGTPVKKANLDSTAVNSPLRRSTRRRSTLDEEPPIISKNISLVETIQEEDDDNVPKRITRSSSKSPNTSIEKTSKSKRILSKERIVEVEEDVSSKETTPVKKRTPLKRAVIIIDDFAMKSKNNNPSPTSEEASNTSKDKFNDDSIQYMNSSKLDVSNHSNNSTKKRSVTFDEFEEEEKAKPIYPKTPQITKSKSYIDLDTSKETEKSLERAESKVNDVENVEDENQQEDEEHNGHDVLLINSKTPYKVRLSSGLSSSTPIPQKDSLLKDGPKNPECIPENIEDNEDKEIIEDEENNENKACTEFAKSWSQSVRKSVTIDDKIDGLGVKELEPEIIPETSHLSPKKRHSVQIIDIDEQEEDNDEEEAENINSFIDDEVEEVDGEEDSMDSEEREYIEQNEVPVRGESIGSEDSHESLSEDEYDENDSFIASEADEVKDGLLEDSEEEELDNSRNLPKAKAGKNYKRIQQCESSSDEENGEKTESAQIDYPAEQKESRRKSLKQDIQNTLSEKINQSFVIEPKEDEHHTNLEEFRAYPDDEVDFNDDSVLTKSFATIKNKIVIELGNSDEDEDDMGVEEIQEKKRRSGSKLNKSNSSENEKEQENNKNRISNTRRSYLNKSNCLAEASEEEELVTLNNSKNRRSNSKRNSVENQDDEGKIDMNSSRKNKSIRKSITDKSIIEESYIDQEIEKSLNNSQLQRSKINKQNSKSLNRSNKSIVQEDELTDDVNNDILNVSQKKRKSTSFSLETSMTNRKSLYKNQGIGEANYEEEVDPDNKPSSKSKRLDSSKDYSLVELNTSKPSNNPNHSISKSIILVEASDFTDQEHEIHMETESLNESSVADGESSSEDENSDGQSFNKSIMSKSLNKSKNNHSETMSTDCEGDVSQPPVLRKLKSKGLSVSFCADTAKQMQPKKSRNSLLHVSFTPGMAMCTNKDSSDSCEIDDINAEDNEVDQSTFNAENEHFDNEIPTEELTEEEELRRLEDVLHVNIYKPRNSMSKVLVKEGKPTKRMSLAGNEILSSSFVENISKQKRKELLQRANNKRLSQSLVEPNPEVKVKESEPERKLLSVKDREDIQYILNRCDAILEEANMAKREAKLKSKQANLKPKRVSKKNQHSVSGGAATSASNPVRKDKIAREISQALLASNQILASLPISKEKKQTKKMPQQVTEHSTPIENRKALKRLPSDFLESLELPKQKKKSNKDYYQDERSGNENSVDAAENVKRSTKRKHKSLVVEAEENDSVPHILKKPSGIFIEEPLETQKSKKSKKTKKIELPTGTVVEEPVTPVKKKNQNGFTVSAATPRAIGFKVRNIISAGQKEIPTLTVDKSAKKKKRDIREPLTVLPKPKWTSSGFLEQSILNEIVVDETAATLFKVSSLSSKKSKRPTGLVNQNALDFKKSTVGSGNIARVSSKELLARKARKIINQKY